MKQNLIRLVQSVALALVATAGWPGHAQAFPKPEVKGLAFRLQLSDNDVKELSKNAAVLDAVIPDPEIKAAIKTSVAIIELTNVIGGRKGVELTGIVGTPAVFIYPQGKGSLFQLVTDAAGRAEKEGKKLWIHYRGIMNGFGDKLAAGWDKYTPFGGGGGGVDVGRMHSNAERIGDWERFRLVALKDNKCAILTHTGYVRQVIEASVGSEFGCSARATTGEIGEGEVLEIEDAGDKKIHIRNVKHGYYLNSACKPADIGLDIPEKLTSSSKNGPIERENPFYRWHTLGCNFGGKDKKYAPCKFEMVWNDDGTFSLKTHDGKYVNSIK